MADLQQYLTHLEKFGPERVLFTAAQERQLTMEELGILLGQIEFWERNYRWRDGRWHVRRTELSIRPCEWCGRDIPRSRGPQAKYCTAACSKRASRARAPQQAPGAPAVARPAASGSHSV